MSVYQPPGNMPVLNTPQTKEPEVGEKLNEDNPIHIPLAQIVQKVNTGVMAAKELLELAKDPVNYPTYAEAFQKAFQKPPEAADEVLESLDRLNLFLKHIRGTPSLDPHDPRMRQEAQRE